jgi:hypothetical protein
MKVPLAEEDPEADVPEEPVEEPLHETKATGNKIASAAGPKNLFIVASIGCAVSCAKARKQSENTRKSDGAMRSGGGTKDRRIETSGGWPVVFATPSVLTSWMVGNLHLNNPDFKPPFESGR